MPFVKNADGSLLLAQTGRYGKEVVYATHNLADKCTWYSESQRVVSGSMADSGDGLTFTSSNLCWIDMEHGKVFDEEGLIEDQKIFDPSDPHGYEISVWSDGIKMTPRAPFETTGGDYTVNHTSGTVSFFASQAGKAVTASYSYADSSAWVLKPLPNKTLIIEKSEVQFSNDIQMQKTFVMEVWGNADFFAPQLGLPAGTPIPIENTKYKTIDQIIDEAVAAFPEIPVLGGPRGYTQPRHVFQFYYAAVRSLFSSLGMFVRIYVENDEPFLGERATATFYCISQTDPGPQRALELLTAE